VLAIARPEEQTVRMKTREILPFVIVIATVAMWLGACAMMENHHGGSVAIEKSRILVHAGTNISKSDQIAMNKVLEKFDKSLYKIRTYEDKKLVKSQGTLRNAWIDRALLAEGHDVAGVPDKSHQNMQFGFISKTHQNPNPPTKPPTVKVPGNAPVSHLTQVTQERFDQEELVEQLKPILEKYSR
jgi:hypothetical protein